MRYLSLLVMGLLMVATNAFASGEKMPAAEALSLSANGEIILVDIRTPQEWQQSGVPATAHLLNMKDKTFIPGLRALMAENPGKPVALICATGGRSGYVTKRLGEIGFPGLINVSEGMFGSADGPGWLKHNLPTRQSTEPPRLN